MARTKASSDTSRAGSVSSTLTKSGRSKAMPPPPSKPKELKNVYGARTIKRGKTVGGRSTMLSQRIRTILRYTDRLQASCDGRSFLILYKPEARKNYRFEWNICEELEDVERDRYLRAALALYVAKKTIVGWSKSPTGWFGVVEDANVKHCPRCSEPIEPAGVRAGRPLCDTCRFDDMSVERDRKRAIAKGTQPRSGPALPFDASAYPYVKNDVSREKVLNMLLKKINEKLPELDLVGHVSYLFADEDENGKTHFHASGGFLDLLRVPGMAQTFDKLVTRRRVRLQNQDGVVHDPEDNLDSDSNSEE